MPHVDDDNPEWTAEQLAKARPADEALPAEVLAAFKPRGKQKAPTKILVHIRLDADVVAAFKATGDGWQTRMNESLKLAAEKLPAAV